MSGAVTSSPPTPSGAEMVDSALEDVRGQSLWQDAWRRLKKNRAAVIAGGVLIAITLFCVIGPWLTPWKFDLPDLEYGAQGPSLRHWFGTGFRGSASFEHTQRLDFEALRGRLMSSSYAPQAGHPQHDPMLRALRELFDNCAEHGTVSFDYDTRIFAGHLA